MKLTSNTSTSWDSLAMDTLETAAPLVETRCGLTSEPSKSPREDVIGALEAAGSARDGVSSVVGDCDTVVGAEVAGSLGGEVEVASGDSGLGVAPDTGEWVSAETGVAGSVGDGVSVDVVGAEVASGVRGDVVTGAGVPGSVGGGIASGAVGTGVGSGRGDNVVA